MRPSPPPLLRALFTGALAWAAVALAQEAGGALTSWDLRGGNVPPCEWRFGMAPVERFRRALSGVEGWLPPGTTVVFVSPPGTCEAEFFRWRWAAYLLPDLEVVQPQDAAAAGAAYEVTYRRPPEPLPGCRLEPVRELDGGGLYRVLR